MKKERCHPGYTHDPWACCQKEAPKRGRPKTDICYDCKKLIAIGKDALKRDADNEIGKYCMETSESNWVRYYGEFDMPHSVRDQLSKAMFSLAQSLSEDRPDIIRWEDPPPFLIEADGKSRHTWYSNVRVRRMARKVRDLVTALDAAIRAALVAVHKDGRERGGSALLRMASGEITLDDFDQRIENRTQR